MDIQEGAATEDPDPLCLGGRGAAPPESCGGPRGYRLMLKRQQQGASVSDPALVEATIQLLSATHPEQPASTWNLLRDAVRQGWQNVERRLLRVRTVGTRSHVQQVADVEELLLAMQAKLSQGLRSRVGLEWRSRILFSLQEANERLATLSRHGRIRL